MVHDFKWLTLVLFLTSVQAAKAVEASDTDLVLQHITASINYLWNTTITNEVWMCEEPCNGTWQGRRKEKITSTAQNQNTY